MAEHTDQLQAAIAPDSSLFIPGQLSVTHALAPPGAHYAVFGLDPAQATRDADRTNNQTVTPIRIP